MDSPFHYVRFGCAMNIKNLGYPYERFTVCIRTYLSVVALVIRIVSTIQARMSIVGHFEVLS